VKYFHNSLSVNSNEMDRLCAAAKENHIVVVLGYSKRAKDSLYIGQSIIDATSELLLSRRKIKPTHMDRTVFDDPAGGADTLFNVVKTTVGRVSGMLCWVTPGYVSLHSICWQIPLLSFMDKYRHILVVVTKGGFYLIYHSFIIEENKSIVEWQTLTCLGASSTTVKISYNITAPPDPYWRMATTWPYKLARATYINSKGWYALLPFQNYECNVKFWLAEGARALTRAFGMESQTFALHTGTVISACGVEINEVEGLGVMSVPGGRLVDSIRTRWDNPHWGLASGRRRSDWSIVIRRWITVLLPRGWLTVLGITQD
jgi:hypothetical protein